MNLAMPRDRTQHEQLKKVLNEHTNSDRVYYYINLVAAEERPLDFRYEIPDGDVPKVAFWDHGEPRRSDELCAVMKKEVDFLWHDIQCSRREYFACQSSG